MIYQVPRSHQQWQPPQQPSVVCICTPLHPARRYVVRRKIGVCTYVLYHPGKQNRGEGTAVRGATRLPWIWFSHLDTQNP